jgi:hypothetical protein
MSSQAVHRERKYWQIFSFRRIKLDGADLHYTYSPIGLHLPYSPFDSTYIAMTDGVGGT